MTCLHCEKAFRHGLDGYGEFCSIECAMARRCRRCGRRKEPWQVYCGAACTALAEAKEP